MSLLFIYNIMFFLLSLAYARTSLDVILQTNVQNKSSAVHGEMSVILCVSILIPTPTLIVSLRCPSAPLLNAGI
jgi:hypothetical protein